MKEFQKRPLVAPGGDDIKSVAEDCKFEKEVPGGMKFEQAKPARPLACFYKLSRLVA